MTNDLLVAKAFAFARDAHEGQQRKYTGEAYIHHCMEVARLVQGMGGTPEMIAAAYLHDTIEDTDTTHRELCDHFGPEVANLVLDLTDVYTSEDYPGLNREERKMLEAVRLGSVRREAKIIKLADLIDNTSTIVKHDPGFAKVYLREKARVMWEMFK